MDRKNPTISKILRIEHHIEDGILIALLASMTGLAISQIFLRNFFNTGFSWASPLLGILVLWVGLSGSIVASRQKNHISINVLSNYLPKNGQLIAEAVVELFTAIVSGIIAYHSARFVLSEYEYEVIAFNSVPAWICELILPVAFGMIALRYLAHSIDDFKQFIRRRRKT